MSKIAISMISAIFCICFVLSAPAQAQQSESVNPAQAQSADQKATKDANKENKAKKAKTRGFDPCLVNPKLPACKKKP